MSSSQVRVLVGSMPFMCAGGDSSWCQEVVKNINHDLNMAGCYDEYVFKTGRSPVYVCTFTKDLANIPPPVRVQGRAGEQAARERDAARRRREAREAREAVVAAGGAVQFTPEEEAALEQQGAAEAALPPSYLQSRMSLHALHTRSLCQHARFRLSAVDKATRHVEAVGVSTHCFESAGEGAPGGGHSAERWRAIQEARHREPERDEHRDDDGALAGWLASGFDGLKRPARLT